MHAEGIAVFKSVAEAGDHLREEPHPQSTPMYYRCD